MNQPGEPLSSGVAPAATLSPLKRAFLALEQAQARVAALEQAAHEPIAVIGLGCRVPGGVSDSAGFWQLMRDGVDAISRVPAERWDIEAFYDADPEVPGKIATREGGFLGSVDRFDPAFFGIAPREAQGMDPQQRLMLEVAWEALEHAGQAPDRLERTATGVYLGVCSSDYTYMQLQSGDTSLLDAHFTSGIAHSVVSGRLSYLLGLQGPSLTLDTACSSSLVAVHLACQALRSGDCRMALAGGVNLILSPDLYIALSRSRMLAPDGRCKTFDAAADGFGRGEGCGVVVLKRLSDAQADGDRVLALIRGSAVNQDGPSSGLTAPNGPAQEAVIREALEQAGIAPDQVGYIEAHGTGTQLGDPLEVQALGSVFGAERERPLLLGSVKTNIGHLEAAAGVTGLIKLVLSLQHQEIPPHLHFEQPSPHIPWSEFALRVPTERTAWQPIGGRRIAGVSSFGFSGTNAHLIVEEAPARVEVSPAAARAAYLFALSARDEAALAALAARHAQALLGRPEEELTDVCFTANAGRAHLAQRATVIAGSMDEMRSRLLALSQGAVMEGVQTARVARREPPRVAFMFTGQGAQYVGMARGLYDTEPVFRAALDRCAALLTPHLQQPLLKVLFAADAEASLLDETAYAQPALFAVEYALTELWRAWGITPSVVIGHSVGEYVAACVAGVLSLEDGLALIAQRGRLMQSLPAGGGMAAVFAPEARVADAIASYRATVSIGAVNAADQTVISGRRTDVEAICLALTGQGVRTQPLTVSHAFHSPLVEPVLDAFEREAAAVRFASPRLRVISNLSGRPVQADELSQPSYWRRHMREAVRFGDGLQALLGLKPDCVIEIGPHPTLFAFASKAWGDLASPQLAASLRKGRNDNLAMAEALSALYHAGAEIDWRATGPGRVVDLPSYPFQRERYWFDAKPKQGVSVGRGRATGHPLLGTRLRSAGTETLYESLVSADVPAFVREHRVQGHVIVPATAYLDTLLCAARDRLQTAAVCVEEVTVREAMLLEEGGAARSLQLVCTPNDDGGLNAAISSQSVDAGDEHPWVAHVSARLRAGTTSRLSALSLAEARGRCGDAIVPAEFYAGFERRGLDFGPGFRSIQRLWRGAAEAVAEVALSTGLTGEAAAYGMHPVLLDGCLQVLAAALPMQAEAGLYLPIAIGRYSLFQSAPSRCWSHVRVLASSDESAKAELRVYREDGSLLAELADVQLKRVSRDALERLGERWLEDCLYETTWRKAPASGTVAGQTPLAELSGAAMAALVDLRRTARLDDYDDFLPRLEALCADYVVHALRRLGWRPAVGEQASEAGLAARLGVQARHGRLFGRLMTILGETGTLERRGDGWFVRRAFDEVQPEQLLAKLSARYPDAAAELELTGRVAAELAGALRGERDPMQLLFPGGSLDTAERMYRDSPTAKVYNGLVAEVMRAAVRGTGSSGKPLRILEIGGGTGGTTAHVAPHLMQQPVEYTFTDVGPLFVARARERFGSHAFMRFEVLDLERDPQSQGFALNGFDVIIASNVVHATARLRDTLDRLRSLLVPGGLLCMLEVTAPQRWFDLTVGLTEGWWAFADTDLRPDYATMSRDGWLELLAERGFVDRAALPAGSGHGGTLGLQSLLLARSGAVSVAEPEAGDWLLFVDKDGIAESIAERLQVRGHRVVKVRAGQRFVVAGEDFEIDPHAAADYRRLLAELQPAGRRVAGALHAWSLDAQAWEAMSAAELADSQARGAVSGTLLAQALVGQQPAPRLWFLTRGAQQVESIDRSLNPAQAPVWGLAKAIALEHPELRCACIDLEAGSDATEFDAIAAELCGHEAQPQLAWRHGQRHVARLARLRRASSSPERPAGAYRLAPGARGSLDELMLQPLERRPPGPGQVEIAVEATGLNFKDVLNTLGMYPGDPGPLGGECAGRVVAVGPGVTQLRAGDAVLAVAGGSFASHVIARAEFVQPRPAGLGAEEAASFPIAFLTAEYCLGHLCGMKAGDRVLVHAAAGGVGMAAVRLAQRAGAQVFATAGSDWKRDLLRSMGVEHVMDSRTAAFAEEILSLTQGQGVDIVLNSLSGELIDASLRALARGGSFVEIGKRDIKTPQQVAALDRDLRYHVVDWGETGERNPALIGAMLARLVGELREGRLAALPRRVFALDDAQRAFRFMAQARHAGKVVLRHGVAPAAAVRRDGTYLVTGGLSGLGPVVARWLAERGAGRLVLVSRRGVTPEVAPLLDEMRALGTSVVAEALDVSDASALGGLLDRLRREGPPLRGVIHSAGLLADAGLLQQDAERFGHVFGPKVRGGWLLDALTRSDPLEWFVLFSSVAAVLGSRGQANHSAANAFLDLLACERRSRGLPGLSINWGAWSDVGAAADRGVAERLSAQGIGILTPTQGLLALQRLLDSGVAQAAVLPIDWRRYRTQLGGSTSVFLADVTTAAASDAVPVAATAAASRGRIALRQQLADVPEGRRRPTVATFVREHALRALGVDPSRAVDPRTPLGDLGLDSLLAVELRNTLGRALGQSLPATLLFDYPTLDTLTDYLLDEVLGFAEVPLVEVAVDMPPDDALRAPAEALVGSIEDLSDDEVDRLLAQRAQRKQ